MTSGEPERQPSERRTDGTDAEWTRDDAEALALLERGTLEVLGLLPRASNFTFLARVRADQDQMLAVYKPRSGEAPLWDFEEGTLAAREVAAYVVAILVFGLVLCAIVVTVGNTLSGRRRLIQPAG